MDAFTPFFIVLGQRRGKGAREEANGESWSEGDAERKASNQGEGKKASKRLLLNVIFA